MRKKILFLSILFIFLILTGCDIFKLSPVNASKGRMTFDIVFEDNTWNGKTCYADIYSNITNDQLTNYIETMHGVITEFPNSTHYHVELTTISEIDSNARYFLDIYIDMDDSGTKNSGDYEATIFGEVLAGYTWTEIHVFNSDLYLVQ